MCIYSPLRNTTLQDVVLWLARRYGRLQVTGDSMLPWLAPGTEVLVDRRAYMHALPQVGDIVVAYHPQKPELRIIKRVALVTPEGGCYLKGDNLVASSDSRQFGIVPLSLIQGRVICTFP